MHTYIHCLPPQAARHRIILVIVQASIILAQWPSAQWLYTITLNRKIRLGQPGLGIPTSSTLNHSHVIWGGNNQTNQGQSANMESIQVRHSNKIQCIGPGALSSTQRGGNIKMGRPSLTTECHSPRSGRTQGKVKQVQEGKMRRTLGRWTVQITT